jgi:hypothetical protein
MRGIIKRTLTNKTRKITQLKFYKLMAAPVLLHGCENWAPNKSRRAAGEVKWLKLNFLEKLLVTSYEMR